MILIVRCTVPGTLTCDLDVELPFPSRDVPAPAPAPTTRQVMEAEMAQANRTDSSYDNDSSRWGQGDGVAGETWTAPQVVADAMV